jgi:hypothetical protein
LSTEAELQIFTLIEQSDEDKMITVQVTTLDVNLGVTDSRTCSNPFTIEIVADADLPLVSTTDPVGVHMEDGEKIPLEISIGQSAGGADGNEKLKVTVTIPQRAQMMIHWTDLWEALSLR